MRPPRRRCCISISSAGVNEVTIALSAEDLVARTREGSWDAVLMVLTFPGTAEEGFASFQQVRQAQPGVPVLLACRPNEMGLLPRFLNHGLRFHIVRDNQADFVFLVLSSLELALAATRAEESQRRYEQLRRYLGE